MKKMIARNKQARRNYHIENTWEAGLVLLGSEVKSLRDGNCSLNEAWCKVKGSEIWLVDCNIPEYKFAHRRTHEAKRERKLLMHANELRRIGIKAVERGFSIIPLEIYWKGARVKLEIGIGRGKKYHDKRTDIADRDAKRDIARQLKRHNG